MFSNGYHFLGMHLVWWFVWMSVFFWIFFTPYNIPGEKRKKDSSLDILKNRFAKGEITIKEYEESKETLEKV